MWHPFIDSWNLLNFERVQNWTRLNYFIKHQIQNVNTRKYSDLLHLWPGKNSTVQDWTQRTVYVFYETVISYVLLKNEQKNMTKLDIENINVECNYQFRTVNV